MHGTQAGSRTFFHWIPSIFASRRRFRYSPNVLTHRFNNGNKGWHLPIEYREAIMPIPKNVRLFYQYGRMTTEFDGLETRSILQHKGGLLAQRTSGAEAVHLILAVNCSNTVMTECGQTNKEQFPYTPYGRRPTQSESTNPLAFNGEQLNSATGCYLLGNGYRAFNPTLMRFVDPDTLSPFDKGGLNAYVYCAGDPVNSIDPTGHFGLPSLAQTRKFMLATSAITAAASAVLFIVGAFTKPDGLTHAGWGVLGFAAVAMGARFAIAARQRGTMPNFSHATGATRPTRNTRLRTAPPPDYDTVMAGPGNYPINKITNLPNSRRTSTISLPDNTSAPAEPPSYADAISALGNNPPLRNPTRQQLTASTPKFEMTELVTGVRTPRSPS